MKKNPIHILYKKLINLYPRKFKEQLGKSMEQTFTDLCNEKRKAKQGLLRLMLWTFIETSIGIIQEHILVIKEMNLMKSILTNLKSPAIISFVLVIPFIALELINRRNFNQDFPFPLFGFMWVLPILFIITMMPIVRNIRAGNSIIANPIILLLRVVFLAFIAWMWVSLLIDQMPCFLGVPNCD